MEKLGRAIFEGHPGTLDKKITAHFRGKLSMGKAAEFGMPPGAKVFALTVEPIEDIQIEAPH